MGRKLWMWIGDQSDVRFQKLHMNFVEFMQRLWYKRLVNRNPNVSSSEKPRKADRVSFNTSLKAFSRSADPKAADQLSNASVVCLEKKPMRHSGFHSFFAKVKNDYKEVAIKVKNKIWGWKRCTQLVWSLTPGTLREVTSLCSFKIVGSRQRSWISVNLIFCSRLPPTTPSSPSAWEQRTLIDQLRRPNDNCIDNRYGTAFFLSFSVSRMPRKQRVGCVVWQKLVSRQGGSTCLNFELILWTNLVSSTWQADAVSYCTMQQTQVSADRLTIPSTRQNCSKWFRVFLVLFCSDEVLHSWRILPKTHTCNMKWPY